MNSKLTTFLFGLLALAIFLIFLSIGLHYWSGGNISTDHGIAIDAGSSKTAFFLYDWSSLKKNETGMVEEVGLIKLNQRLTDNIESKVLISTFNQLASYIHYSRNKQNIPIYLGATAGMRLLNLQNKEKSDTILNNVKSTFDHYTESQRKFTVKGVEIITGEKEGLYCWISANYLLGFVPRDNLPYITVGTLDMGGASAQIAYTVSSSSKDNPQVNEVSGNIKPTESVRLFGVDYGVYTYSNLCYGKDQAMKRYFASLIFKNPNQQKIKDPCTHPKQLDYTKTRSEITDTPCIDVEIAKKKMNFETYTFIAEPDTEKCKEYTNDLVDVNYVDENFKDKSFVVMNESPRNDIDFYAIATYYYSVSQIRQGETIEFEDEAKFVSEFENYCKKSWDEIVKDHKQKEEFLRTYCFSLNYVYSTLKKVYKFNGSQFKNIKFKSKFNGHDLGWALGYMLQATNQIPGGNIEEPILNKTGFVIIFLIGVILSIGAIFIYWKKK